MKSLSIISACVLLAGGTASYLKAESKKPAKCTPVKEKTYTPPPIPNDRPVFVLSVDGGGVRGSIPQHILAKLEEIFGKHPTKLFDVFSGTSAGSIVVAFMNMKKPDGTPSFSAQDAENMSETVSKVVFKQPSWRKFRALGGLLGAKYSAKPMEEALQGYMGDFRISNTIKPVIIPAFDMNVSEVFDFSTSQGAKNSDKNFYLRDAVRSSTSAPTYFKPYELNYCAQNGMTRTMAMADGAVGSYNPEVEGYKEAKALYPNHKIVMVSISTGRQPKGKEVATQGWRAGSVPGILMDFINGNFDAQKQRAEEIMHTHKCKADETLSCIANRHRIEFEVPKEYSSLDSATEKNIAGLRKVAREITNLESNPKFSNESLKASNEQFKNIVKLLSKYHTPVEGKAKEAKIQTKPAKDLSGMCHVKIMGSHTKNYDYYYARTQRKVIGTGFKPLSDIGNLETKGKKGDKQYILEFDTPCNEPIRIRAKKNALTFWTATINFNQEKGEAHLLSTVEGILKKPKVRCAIMKGATCTDGITTK